MPRRKAADPRRVRGAPPPAPVATAAQKEGQGRLNALGQMVADAEDNFRMGPTAAARAMLASARAALQNEYVQLAGNVAGALVTHGAVALGRSLYHAPGVISQLGMMPVHAAMGGINAVGSAMDAGVRGIDYAVEGAQNVLAATHHAGQQLMPLGRAAGQAWNVFDDMGHRMDAGIAHVAREYAGPALVHAGRAAGRAAVSAARGAYSIARNIVRGPRMRREHRPLRILPRGAAMARGVDSDEGAGSESDEGPIYEHGQFVPRAAARRDAALQGELRGAAQADRHAAEARADAVQRESEMQQGAAQLRAAAEGPPRQQQPIAQAPIRAHPAPVMQQPGPQPMLAQNPEVMAPAAPHNAGLHHAAGAHAQYGAVGQAHDDQFAAVRHMVEMARQQRAHQPGGSLPSA